MKRTKEETKGIYLTTMSNMWLYGKKPFHLRDLINRYKVNASVGSALIKAGYIGSTLRCGYYVWKKGEPTMSDVETILSMLKKPKYSTQDPKSTTSIGFADEVYDLGKALDKAYPKENKGWIAINMGSTMEQREQAAINILGTIMRDNQHITYDLIRIERKEVKTDLLAR